MCVCVCVGGGGEGGVGVKNTQRKIFKNTQRKFMVIAIMSNNKSFMNKTTFVKYIWKLKYRET